MSIIKAKEAGDILKNARNVIIIDDLSSLYPKCKIDGYEFIFFNDAGDLDYVEQVIASDGRQSTHIDWQKEAEKTGEYPANPVDFIDLYNFQEKYF